MISDPRLQNAVNEWEAAPMTRLSSTRFAIWMLSLLAGVAGFTSSAAAHGSGRKVTVPIVQRDAKGPRGPYRIAFGCIPPSPVRSQVVRCEVKALAITGSLPRRPVTIEAVEGGRVEALAVEEEEGAYAIEHGFERAGDKQLRVRIGTDEAVSFPLRVQPGNIESLQWGFAAIVVLTAAGVVARSVRRRRKVGDPWAGRAASYGIVTAVAVAVVVWGVAPFVGRRAVVTHGDAAVDWSAFEQPEEKDLQGDVGDLVGTSNSDQRAVPQSPELDKSAGPLSPPTAPSGRVKK